MLEEVKKVLAGIRKDTEKVIRSLTENHIRCERYDVTTAPNGSVIGVTQPYGTEELLIPYSWMCSNATVGDTVIVVWWNGLSNAQAWFMGGGWVDHLLSITPGGGGITVNGTLNVAGDVSMPGNVKGRILGLGEAREQIQANADFNDYTEPGVYGINDGNIYNTMSNRPSTSGTGGVLWVFNSVGNTKNNTSTWYYVSQEFRERDTGKVWRRRGNTTGTVLVVWSSWVANQNDAAFSNSENYVKLPDGTLIQWGIHTFSGTGNMSQINSTGIYTTPLTAINLATTFYDTSYVVSASGRYLTGNILACGAIASTTAAFLCEAYDFYARSLTDGNLKIHWKAIGRWK